jgi:hypothetical protein
LKFLHSDENIEFSGQDAKKDEKSPSAFAAWREKFFVRKDIHKYVDVTLPAGDTSSDIFKIICYRYKNNIFPTRLSRK